MIQYMGIKVWVIKLRERLHRLRKKREDLSHDLPCGDRSGNSTDKCIDQVADQYDDFCREVNEDCIQTFKEEIGFDGSVRTRYIIMATTDHQGSERCNMMRRYVKEHPNALHGYRLLYVDTKHTTDKYLYNLSEFVAKSDR